MRLRCAAAATAALMLLAPGGALAEPSPSAPAPAVTAAQQQNVDAAFIAWAQHVMACLERANAAMAPFLQVRSDMETLTATQARQELAQLMLQAAHARAEMAAARADLTATQPFADPRATPEMLQMGAVLLRDSRASAGNLEQFLSDMIDMMAAIDRGDQAEAERIEPRLNSGALLMVQAQATMLRARQPMLPAMSSTYHAIAGMASMYDGMAGLMADNASFDPGVLETAASALDVSLAAERGAVMLERASVPEGGRYSAVINQIVDTHAQLADANERARDVLRTAAQEGRAGASSEASRMEHIRVLAQLEYEYQAISRRELELRGQIAR